MYLDTPKRYTKKQRFLFQPPQHFFFDIPLFSSLPSPSPLLSRGLFSSSAVPLSDHSKHNGPKIALEGSDYGGHGAR